jgi:hypothetical protein
VTQDLTVVEDIWRLRADDNAQRPDPGLLNVYTHMANTGFDVLRALKVTTNAIRSVRNYLLSLPDEHGSDRHPRQSFRPTPLSTSEPQKRRGSSRKVPACRSQMTLTMRAVTIAHSRVSRPLPQSPMRQPARRSPSRLCRSAAVASPF